MSAPATLQVGYVEVDGFQYQASDTAVSKKGVSSEGCDTVVNTSDDALDCPGWFDFSAVTDQSSGGSSGGAGQVTVTYDHNPATGQATAINYPDGGSRSFTYDTAGRVVLDELTDDTGSVTASLGYGWSCESDLVLEDINLPGNTGSGEQTFTYDRAGRLSSWDKTGGVAAVESCGEGTPSGETYTYDARGNRLTAGSRSFTYDNRNRLTTDPDGDYSWSAAGAMESFTDTGSGVTESFTRDAAHRLTGVSDGTDSVAYSYDVMDRIATRDTSEVFAYAGAGIDPVADGTDSYARSSSQALFAYEPAGGGFLFPMSNLHGDVVGYIDSSGALVGASTYDPYGDPDDTTGTTSRLGYQGDWTEPDNGRVWMGARWYQPSTATFLTRDTYFGELGTPFSLNRYTYAINNPTRYWDPDGRCSLLSCDRDRFLDVNGVTASQKLKMKRPKTTSRRDWDHFVNVNVTSLDALASSVTRAKYAPTSSSATASEGSDEAEVVNDERDNSGVEPVSFGGSVVSMEQSRDIEISDAFAGARDFAVDSLTDVAELGGLVVDGLSCVGSFVGWGSCDKLAEARDALVETAATVFDAIKSGDARAILGVLESFLPERCRSGSFELDYCVGYGAGALAKQMLTGGAGAAAAMSRINRLGNKVPGAGRLDEVVPQRARVRACSANSFVPGTEVLMADGATRPIEEVELGDLVWAADPETGQQGSREVTRLITGHGDKTLVDIEIDGKTVTATDHHPIWVNDQGEWVDAENLQPGDFLLDETGVTVLVDDIDIRRVSDQAVHNLTVDDLHTFFVLVGDDPILTHNNDCSPAPRAQSPTYNELRAAGQADAHHIIQHAAVRDVSGYSRGQAPAVQLDGPSTRAGSPHYNATQVQRQPGGGTYGSERQIAACSLAAAGCSSADIADALARADAYFIDQLGLTVDSPLRIPANRP